MDSEIVGSVTEWETVPTEQGYDGLHALANTEFSGGVTAGNTWGFMLNGRLVGIPDGSLAASDGAALTAYESPTPALPSLYSSLLYTSPLPRDATLSRLPSFS